MPQLFFLSPASRAQQRLTPIAQNIAVPLLQNGRRYRPSQQSLAAHYNGYPGRRQSGSDRRYGAHSK